MSDRKGLIEINPSKLWGEIRIEIGTQKKVLNKIKRIG